MGVAATKSAESTGSSSDVVAQAVVSASAEVASAGVGGAVILFLIRIAQLKPESRCISTQLKVFLSLLVL